MGRSTIRWTREVLVRFSGTYELQIVLVLTFELVSADTNVCPFLGEPRTHGEPSAFVVHPPVRLPGPWLGAVGGLPPPPPTLASRVAPPATGNDLICNASAAAACRFRPRNPIIASLLFKGERECEEKNTELRLDEKESGAHISILCYIHIMLF